LSSADTNRRACAFCRATDRKISKEHVWPKWLRRVIELGEGPPVGRSRTHRTSEGGIVSHKEWRETPIDWQVAAVCKPCNEGWMERIESETRPILTPLLGDEAVLLPAAAQAILARWITLRVMVAQYGHPAGKQVIPAGAYDRFYRSRELPGGAQIWIGRYGGAGAWPTQYHHVELYASGSMWPEPARPNLYLVACSIGYVAFIYWGHEIADMPAVDAQGLADYLLPIWPASEFDVAWPPPGVLGENGVEAALRRFPID
jgi:hypothetical protein